MFVFSLGVILRDVIMMYGYFLWFLDGVRIFLNADPDRGFCPDSRRVADWCGFFYFWIWGGAGLIMWRSDERRFASLLRIAAPHL